MRKVFDLILENKEIYRMEIGWNFHKYTIKKGVLFKGFKKLGKIHDVKEVLKCQDKD